MIPPAFKNLTNSRNYQIMNELQIDYLVFISKFVFWGEEGGYGRIFRVCYNTTSYHVAICSSEFSVPNF